ncbi:alpha/beta hydrolase [Alcaligenaceae bacterium]|nr:alpha/beta hydrolase [Alcaligenaceae bacterium]
MTKPPSDAPRPTLLFAHGWALDRSMWSALRAALPAWPQNASDAGYFGDARHAEHQGPVIVVGHSLGFLQALSYLPPDCVGLVAINGFTRFCAAPDYEDGVPNRLVDRMLSRLPTHTHDVVQAFRARCDLDMPPTPPHPERLLHDLKLLRHADGRQAAAAIALPLLVLAGRCDTVVSPAMTRASFAGARHARVFWHDEARHMLPASHPEWCARHIDEFVNAVIDSHHRLY